jgi:hypothetical protein
MNVYKIYNNIKSYFQKFNTLEEAQTFAASLGPDYSAEFIGPYTPPTIEERLSMDLDFCNSLTLRFVEENRAAGITEAQSLALMAQFKDILSFAQVGAVGSVYSLLQGITPGEIYTQERKDKDLNDINNYLNSF